MIISEITPVTKDKELKFSRSIFFSNKINQISTALQFIDKIFLLSIGFKCFNCKIENTNLCENKYYLNMKMRQNLKAEKHRYNIFKYAAYSD